MRLDKYLKLSKLIKRRTIAQEMICDGLVRISGKGAKPSSDIREGDVIEIEFVRRMLRVRVLCADEPTMKRNKNLEAYELLEEIRSARPEE